MAGPKVGGIAVTWSQNNSFSSQQAGGNSGWGEAHLTSSGKHRPAYVHSFLGTPDARIAVCRQVLPWISPSHGSIQRALRTRSCNSLALSSLWTDASEWKQRHVRGLYAVKTKNLARPEVWIQAWIWDLGTLCSVYTVCVKSDISEELGRRRNDDLHFPEHNSNGSIRKEQSALFNCICSRRRVRKLKTLF